ncbi:hypothetical protein DMUE_0857 [Dictyocoela muelleri]|nr:hypothetical protein DMUE_0857 [Dictyocoela muelleri]
MVNGLNIQSFTVDFSQLYTIHGIIFCTRIPLVYCLMKHKNEDSYEKLLKILYEQINYMPKFIVTDFEFAAIYSFRKIFPSAKLRGCHFHYAQSIWRNVQKSGLTSNYKNDDVFNNFIRSLISLAYVPNDKIIFGYFQIKTQYKAFLFK